MKALVPSFVLPYIGTVIVWLSVQKVQTIDKINFNVKYVGRFPLQLQTCASIWSLTWGKNTKLDSTCINCGSSVIKTAELKSHEMLHIGKSLSNAIFLRNISIQPASYIVIFRLHFYVLSRRNDLSALGEKKLQKVQLMRQLILWARQFEDAFDEEHSGEKTS